MDKYITLIKKLDKSIEIDMLNSQVKKTNLFLFFNFILNNEFVKKIDQIYEKLFEIKLPNFFEEFDDKLLDNSNKFLLLAIFIFKSVNKTSITPITTDIRYLNSDTIINTIISYYLKFIVFYFNKEINDNIKLKKSIFRLLSTLVEYGIIKQQIIRNSGKTIKEWSFGFSTIVLSSQEYLNLNFTPFELLQINNNHYLKGKTFTNVHKIFEENIKSESKFQFKTQDYLNRIIKTPYYINQKDLLDVLNIIENKKQITEEYIVKEINKLNEEIKFNLKKIKTDVKNLKKQYLENSKKIVNEFYDSFLETENKEEKFVNKLILDFCSNVLKELYIVIDEEKYSNLKIILENIFNSDLQEKKPKNVYKFHKIMLAELFEINEETAENEELKENVIYDNYNKTQLEFNTETTVNSSFDYINEDSSEENIKLKNINFSLIELFFMYNNQEIEKILEEKKNMFNNLNDQNLVSANNNNLVWNIEKIHYFGLRFLVKDQWKHYHHIKKNLNISLIENNKIKNSFISELMIYYNLYLLKNCNLSNDQPIYLPFFFDFRGRFYYISSISPTNLKYSRYIFNYGIYNEIDLNSNEQNILSLYIYPYIEYIEYIKKKYNIKRSSLKINETIFWILISIGKIDIKKEEVEISAEDIIKIGIKILEKENTFNLIDTIELMHYTKILNSLTEDRVIARGILKDATASFIQNLIRIMGYKDQNSLKYANLYSTKYWYDTYSFILNKWLNKVKQKNIDPKFLKIFTRKTVKKTIMTNPYSAAYLTAFNYFRDSVKEQYNILLDFGSPEEIIFKDFYKFISNDVENKYFLKNNSKKMVEYIKEVLKKNNREIIIESDDAKTNMVYFKMHIKNFDLIITIPQKQIKKRITKKYEKIDIDNIKVDYKKIARSIRANWVHYTDALLLRDINKASKKTYITIHDCFIVDFLNISEFIIIANNESNKKIFKQYEWNKENIQNFFSIFIFI